MFTVPVQYNWNHFTVYLYTKPDYNTGVHTTCLQYRHIQNQFILQVYTKTVYSTGVHGTGLHYWCTQNKFTVQVYTKQVYRKHFNFIIHIDKYLSWAASENSLKCLFFVRVKSSIMHKFPFVNLTRLLFKCIAQMKLILGKCKDKNNRFNLRKAAVNLNRFQSHPLPKVNFKFQ